MKKILGVLAVCLMLVGFASCGEDEDTDSYITFTFNNGNGDNADWAFGISSTVNDNGAFAAIIGSGTGPYTLKMLACGFGGADVDSIKLIVTSSAEFAVNQAYTSVAGTVYKDGDAYTISNSSVTLTKIGDVDGIISGTFTGTLTGGQSDDYRGPISGGRINLKRVSSAGLPDDF